MESKTCDWCDGTGTREVMRRVLGEPHLIESDDKMCECQIEEEEFTNDDLI